MQELLTTMRVDLGAPHHHASLTDHGWMDSTGSYKFEPFYRLEIKQEPGKHWCFLFCFTKDARPHGQVSESEFQTVEEALCQAEWEFGVRHDEWKILSPQVTNTPSNP